MLIQYLNLKNAGDNDTYIKSLVEKSAEKLERDLSKESILIVDIKEYNQEGKRAKFSVHLRLEAPAHMLAAHAHDWDVITTTRKALKKLETEFKHKFKTEGTKYKSRIKRI
ncbi:MAG: hypothetical protein HYS32_02975 [Candidatus Woesearchaeota archaeon]|nr:MAG: hypothetical protein HYS32_02975 [Candidatus Woesearchaeota archaeon]